MADTIAIRRPAEHVVSIGGDRAWQEALGLANAEAVSRGWNHLPSQRYDDCVIMLDPVTQEYIFSFGETPSLDFTVAAKSGYVPIVGL